LLFQKLTGVGSWNQVGRKKENKRKSISALSGKKGRMGKKQRKKGSAGLEGARRFKIKAIIGRGIRG